MEQTVLARLVRPFYGRATAIESSVDEVQTDGGLIVPLQHDDDEGVRRGVILHVDNPWDEGSAMHTLATLLEPGTVVFYQGGTRIRDVIVLSLAEILAFEAAE